MQVDVVYTWVNDKDPKWIKMHEAESERLSSDIAWHRSVNSSARYSNRWEIFYSIRSLKKYADWIDKIYIVTNCDVPKRILDLGVVVPHEDIFPDVNCLPSFNSRAIESCLHRIDGLSEYFLYLNDDVFFASHSTIGDFYSNDGVVSVFPSKHDIKYDGNGLRPVDYGAIKAGLEIERRFNFRPVKKLHHAPFALRKSVLFEIEKNYGEEVEVTRLNKFKQKDDFPLATTFFAYYAIATDFGCEKSCSCRYIDIGDVKCFALLTYIFFRLKRYQFICLNEVFPMKFFSKIRDLYLSVFMRLYF
ncbi:Stealth CR1 domain-containing protein [Spongiibacter taiwanensis]|uniref:stealth conserved region 3 domain-containing protein n=1 Tax=Spongiibacter taiwanensis TaxID=1748242 RepID=UPI00203618E0|nr:stealth conserved region 3 domain-containing protein [Spongiibacter taiwanensis]USA44256.1 Stealth CR1 domain-containing protein [Spongiibacter taiwanensis]